MAQPVYLSPRPSPHPLQHRRTTSARKSGLFRPPQSPATPARHPSYQRRTPNYAAATATSTSRKRARPEPNARVDSKSWAETPQSELGSTWTIPSLEASAVRSDFASPEPFVNTRYNLAGGLDTPGQARETYFERSVGGHEDYGVRRRWTVSHATPDESMQSRRPSVKNGSPAQQQSWGQFVFSVAGKMWQFGSSAFKGFYAGGGRGYQMEAQPPMARFSSEDSVWESLRDASVDHFERDSTPVPGSYPVDQDDTASPQQRPAKKAHLDSGESPWVLVQNPMEDELHRKREIHQPPPHSRPSSSRRSLIPITRRGSSHLNSFGSPAVQSSNRSASYAHQRSSSDVTPVAQPSPLSPEAHRYLADRRREERQHDASIKRMNDQLKALLKEGRQALGTKVEIVMDDEGMDIQDEGYFEDSR